MSSIPNQNHKYGKTNDVNKRLSDPYIKVVAITGGKNVPSRRFRIDTLKPYLSKKSIELKELCPVINTYPPPSWLLRPPWFIAALLERLTFLQRARGYHAVILQREMISTFPTLERLLPKLRILDVDDAIYLHRNGKAAKYIARSCSLVVCGNHYLAEKFSQWNSNVIVIPTGVDTEQLHPVKKQNFIKGAGTIGWIGTSGNYRYLASIESSLKKVLTQFPNTKLQIISNQFPTFLKHLGGQLDFRLWRPGIENDLLPQFTVGIMPLIDSEWASSKCAFKMLQYMAAGIPVVVSPIGITRDIIDQSDIGMTAVNENQWTDALALFLSTPESGIRAGMNGRQLVEKYSLKSVSKQWSKALLNLLGE
jgi:glycosyltransferase involved in cell wall biosynthesis